jgi:post-segregation antitoxin (ccd killing protein)
VALVANASKDAEAFLLSRWKPKVRRNFKKMLRTLLEQEFPHLHPEFRLLGSSQKQHTFDFAVDRSRGGLVLLDAVHNDANAISSAIARNVDVSRLVRHEIEQRIVYDDEEEWRAEDLNLLSLGAKVIPLSQASAIVAKLAA